jgi:polyhydroxyalkanoic acid synthase PhaR subunit
MAENRNDGFDPNDPIGNWRAIRDANLDAWAKSMTQMVDTEAYSKMIGIQMDTLLSVSGPYQKAFQQFMENYLAQANMPSRNDVVNLSDRLTNIEMRLDDMEARLDDFMASMQSGQASPVAAGKVDELLASLQSTRDALADAGNGKPAAAKPAAPRRTRKTDE